jgi:anthranilate phosphoribosyltransferase
VLKKLITQMAQGAPLASEQVERAVESLVDEAISTEEKADFLTALAKKGETVEEITAFATALRARALKPDLDDSLRSRPLLDVVGTGGDRLSTFNISTTVALLASAAGVQVVKHGNRASTSPIGSADVMEALGIPFDLGPQEAVAMLREHGFAYFFAPRYHPCFRHIMPARRLCGQRGQVTIFNFLGPLLNPAQPSAMLLGVPRPELCEPLAKVIQSMGVRRGMVVSGSVRLESGEVRHLDEISPLGQTVLAEFYHESGFNVSTLHPELFPLQPVHLPDLHGGDREYNADTIRRVLNGKERGPKRDVVLLNAAAALLVADRVRTLAEGWLLAAETIDSGKAQAQFARLAKLGN